MEITEAKEIVKLLADGINPETGEIFPDDSPYQNPKIIRALFAALRTMEYEERRSQRRGNLPENAGKPWDKTEDDSLSRKFDAGVDIASIAREHKRTQGAIKSRLVYLGKMAAPDWAASHNRNQPGGNP